MMWKDQDLKKVGFKQKKEKDYIVIEFPSLIQLDCIIIHGFLSKDFFYSMDGVEWKKIDFRKQYISNTIKQCIGLKTCYIKYAQPEINVEFYTRKFPGLVVAARSDGLGARFMPILNALCLSDYTGFKFGFVWPSSRPSDVSKKYDEMCLKDNRSYMALPDEKYIFNPDFINDYSYTGILSTNRGLIGRRVYYERLLQAPYDFDWGWYISHTTSQVCMPKIDINYAKKYKMYWDKIQFSDHIKNIISQAERDVKKIGKFVAIHIRTGDIVYKTNLEPRMSAFWGKALPIELALECINIETAKKNKIILFSDDFACLNKVIKYYKSNNILNIENLIPRNLIDNHTDRLFYELVYMMNSELIYSGSSSLARTASFISRGDEPIMPLINWDKYKINQVFLKNLDLVYVSQKQSAFSYFCAAMNLRNNYNAEDEKHYLYFIDKAISQDGDNPIYIILLIEHYIKNKNKNKLRDILMQLKFNEFFCKVLLYGAVNITKDFMIALYQLERQMFYEFLYKILYFDLEIDKINEYLLEIQHVLFDGGHMTLSLSELKEKKEAIFYFYILKEIKNISFKHGTAKDRIHNHLSYKLGQAMIENSKSLLGYIRMPFVLSYIKDKHKQEQQQYQEAIKKNPNLKLPNLESYPDYKESLKEKECLAYKLGEAFIKANKTWYKGGYVKLWFEVRKLKERFLK